MPYNVPPTKAADDFFTAAEFNLYVRDNDAWLLDQAATKHGCTLRRAVAQSMVGAAYTELLWDTEIEDTDSYHSTVTNTARVTIPAGLAGIYTIAWQSQPAGAAAGQAAIRKNGIAMVRHTAVMPFAHCMWTGPLIVGDYITAALYSGNATANDTVNLTATADYPLTPNLYCYKVG